MATQCRKPEKFYKKRFQPKEKYKRRYDKVGTIYW